MSPQPGRGLRRWLAVPMLVGEGKTSEKKRKPTKGLTPNRLCAQQPSGFGGAGGLLPSGATSG